MQVLFLLPARRIGGRMHESKFETRYSTFIEKFEDFPLKPVPRIYDLFIYRIRGCYFERAEYFRFANK